MERGEEFRSGDRDCAGGEVNSGKGFTIELQAENKSDKPLTPFLGWDTLSLWTKWPKGKEPDGTPYIPELLLGVFHVYFIQPSQQACEAELLTPILQSRKPRHAGAMWLSWCRTLLNKQKSADLIPSLSDGKV